MKAKYLLRYRFIIEKLQRSQYSSYDDIEQYIFDNFEILGFELSYSKRTFQRDKNDIEQIFGIFIKYNAANMSYYIDENDIPDSAKKLLDAFTVTNALQLYDDFSKYISFEKENLGRQGMFYELNYAVKNKYRIKIHYQKYYEENFETRELKPLALKEFAGRWYLVALRKDDKNNKEVTRTYGLDRILYVEKLKAKFKTPDFDLNEYFKNFCGIITDEDTAFEEVILSFDSFQGNYVKSLPLHHSQEILIDTEDELRIKLKLHITFDFIQKLLSYGKFMKVLEPESLKNEVKEELREAFGLYE